MRLQKYEVASVTEGDKFFANTNSIAVSWLPARRTTIRLSSRAVTMRVSKPSSANVRVALNSKGTGKIGFFGGLATALLPLRSTITRLETRRPGNCLHAASFRIPCISGISKSITVVHISYLFSGARRGFMSPPWARGDPFKKANPHSRQGFSKTASPKAPVARYCTKPIGADNVQPCSSL